MYPTYRECFYRSQDDLKLYYRDYGDSSSHRTTLLCLSGLTRNSRDFDRFAANHAAERRVICLDYRGRGHSQYDPDWHNYQIEAHLNDIRHLFAVLSLHKVIAVGTSFGGILSMGLGVLQPAVLAGVILNDAGPELGASGLGRIFDYISRDRPHPDWPSAITELKGMFRNLSLKTDEDWQRMAEGTFHKGKDGLLHFDWDVRLARALLTNRESPPDLWPFYRSLRKVPVLALRGEISDMLSEACFERMAREKPDLVRVTVPGVGHAPSLAEPVAREAIAAFLERL